MRANIVKRAALAAAIGAVAVTVATMTGIMPTPALAGPPILTCDEAAAAGLLPIPPPRKVTLCHFTGSESNPFVINQPSESSADNHFGHHGDCVRYSDGSIDCNI